MTAAPPSADSVVDWSVAWRFALREMRGGLKGFRVFLACLALGVFAIAAVGSLSAMIVAGIEDNARTLLGGDVEIFQTAQDVERPVLDYLSESAEAVTVARELRAMARSARPSGARTLVELKSVDGAYPLYGAVRLANGGNLAPALAERDGRFGAVAEDTLLLRLRIDVGDIVRVGDIDLEIRGVLAEEPDRVANAFSLGPRLLVGDAALDAAGLVQEGSLIRFRYRARLAPGTSYETWEKNLRARFPEAGWRARNAREAQPSIKRFVERLAIFLTLAGVTALVVGGIGVGNAINAYLGGKIATIATLKCLGARSGLIFRTYFLQVGLLAAIGIAVGLVLGILAPYAGLALFGSSLPVPAKVAVYPLPLALAAAFGALTAMSFALWPLARARDIPAAGLFRDLVAPTQRWPAWPFMLLTALAASALAALAIFGVGQPFIAAWFVVGAVGALVVFRAAAVGVVAGVRLLPRIRYPFLRLALANLVRPGAPTAAVVVSLGVGITVLVATALVQGNLDRQVKERIPDRAPTFFFLDIQPDQVTEFERLLRGGPGFVDLERTPNLRARLVGLKGLPVEDAAVAASWQWARRGEFGATYAGTRPRRTTIISGEWWPASYAGEPLVSLDEAMARGLNLAVGDPITFNILGRDITARIANLRRIDWSDFGINFMVVFAPGALDAAPQTHVATASVERSEENATYLRLTDRFANVSTVRVRDVIDAATRILNRIASAAAGAASITVLAGLFVLAGAVAAGHRRRVYEAVILKVIGATRGDVLRAYMTEFAFLGLLTGGMATGGGTLAAYLIITQVMAAEWRFMPDIAFGTAAAGVVVTMVFGFVGTWAALSQRAAPVLRTA
ncbi:MAG: FtsX-like permease family protein [Alphaproteobacteria bacterium]|nr:FtsX-like permease family protein [Alphaproteobacteria bacterium]